MNFGRCARMASALMRFWRFSSAMGSMARTSASNQSYRSSGIAYPPHFQSEQNGFELCMWASPHAQDAFQLNPQTPCGLAVKIGHLRKMLQHIARLRHGHDV